MKRFIEFIKYTWKAKGRHGIHSPFVYDLVDKCFRIQLKNKYNVHLFGNKKHTTKSVKLIVQLVKHFQIKELASNKWKQKELEQLLVMENLTCSCLPFSELTIENRQSFKLFYFSLESNPQDHFTTIVNLTNELNDQTIIVIDGIRQSDETNLIWNKLKNHSSFHFSADLYSIGILSKRSQKVKEHFVLRY